MTALHERLPPSILVDLLAQEIRRVDGSHSLGAAALAEALMPFLAAQSLQAQEAVKETTINHSRDPHCCGCYVIRWNDGDPVAVCGECGVQVALLDRLVAPEGWELFGYVGAFSADAMKRCAKDEHNGCVEVWMRRRTDSDVPVYHSSPTHPAAALQAGEV